MIDMSRTKTVLTECAELVNDLHGVDLDETDPLSNQSGGEVRKLKARRSQDLELLATRLELAAQLVQVEYYDVRGKGDPLSRERSG